MTRRPASTQRQRWTQPQLSRLIKLWRAGVSDAGIAVALGRSTRAVVRRRQRLRLVERQRRVDVARMLLLHAEGRTTQEIAAELGCTFRTVQELRWRNTR